ncbi:MAG: hypothetical protein FRX49_06465 [Trebouxia sp. A1-2]|nr:MAG: hypothetical protein FRX49_06465 [Trebouxia sp. A1-2]
MPEAATLLAENDDMVDATQGFAIDDKGIIPAISRLSLCHTLQCILQLLPNLAVGQRKAHLLVSCEDPDSDASVSQAFNGLRHSRLQLVLNGSAAQQQQLALYQKKKPNTLPAATRAASSGDSASYLILAGSAGPTDHGMTHT